MESKWGTAANGNLQVPFATFSSRRRLSRWSNGTSHYNGQCLQCHFPSSTPLPHGLAPHLPLPLVLPLHPRPSIAPAPVIRYAAQPSTGSPEQSTTITSFIVTSSVTVQVQSQCAACLTYSAQTTPPSDGRPSCAALLAAQISHNPLDSLILTSPNPPFWTPSRRHLAAAIGRGIPASHLDVSCLTTSSRILLLSSYCLHTLLLRRLFSAAWLFGAFARLLWTLFFFYGPYYVVVCLLPTTYWIPARQLHTVCSTSFFYCSISSHASSSSSAAFAFSLHPPKNIPFRHRHALLSPCHAVSQPLVSLKEPFPSSVLDSAHASYPPLLSVRRRSRDIDIIDTFHRHIDDLDTTLIRHGKEKKEKGSATYVLFRLAAGFWVWQLVLGTSLCLIGFGFRRVIVLQEEEERSLCDPRSTSKSPRLSTSTLPLFPAPPFFDCCFSLPTRTESYTKHSEVYHEWPQCASLTCLSRWRK